MLHSATDLLNLREAPESFRSHRREPCVGFPWIRSQGLRFAAALVVALSANILLGSFRGRLRWEEQAAFVTLAVSGMILMRFGLGLRTIWCAVGGLAFAWHPLIFMCSSTARWIGVAAIATILLASKLRDQKYHRLILSFAVGLATLQTLGLSWVAILVLVFAISQQLTRPDGWGNGARSKYWEYLVLMGGFVLAIALSPWTPFASGLPVMIAEFESPRLTSLGPLAWFDCSGLIGRSANWVPTDVSQSVDLGYLGVTFILVMMIALWPGRPRLGHARTGLPQAVIALGFWAIWPICIGSSFHAQMTRLFAVITIERQVSIQNQHVLGLVAALAYLMPVLVLFALRGSISKWSISPLSLAAICGLSMVWWSASPPGWNWASYLTDHSSIEIVRIVLALAFGTGVCLALERIAGYWRSRWPGYVLAILVLGLIAIDLGNAIATMPDIPSSETETVVQSVQSP